MKQSIIVTLLLSISMVSLYSETVSLEQAVELALHNNFSVQTEENNLDIAKLKYERIWNGFMPSLSASASLARSNETISYGGGSALIPTGEYNPFGSVPSDDEPVDGTLYDYVLYKEFEAPETDPWALAFQLNAQLALNAGMFMNIKSSRMNYESGAISLETAKSQAIRDVKKSFYNLLLMKENISLMEDSLATAKKRWDQAQTNYESGLIPQLSVLQARVGYETQRPAIESLTNGYEIALMKMKIDLGFEPTDDLALDGAIPEPSGTFNPDELAQLHIADRLDIQNIRAAIEAMKYGNKVQQVASMTPTLVIGASYAPAISSIFTEDTEWSGDDNDWSDRGSITFSLSLPVDSWIPYSSSWTASDEMEMKIEQMEAQVEYIAKMADMEIRSLVMNLENSLKKLEALKYNVELAQEAYSLTEAAYEAGSKELLEVENAEGDLNNAKLEVLREKYTYISNLLDLEYALNITIE